MKRFSLCLILVVFSLSAFASDGKGKISNVFFSGSAFGSHPNVVQFNIEGGFSRSGCSSVFAAVRSEDAHLVSALLAAKMSGIAVDVYLNPDDIYYDVEGNYPKRCIAMAISIP